MPCHPAPLDVPCRRARTDAGGALGREALDAGTVASGASIKPGEARDPRYRYVFPGQQADVARTAQSHPARVLLRATFPGAARVAAGPPWCRDPARSDIETPLFAPRFVATRSACFAIGK
jgi:hypothetical protein